MCNGWVMLGLRCKKMAGWQAAKDYRLAVSNNKQHWWIVKLPLNLPSSFDWCRWPNLRASYDCKVTASDASLYWACLRLARVDILWVLSPRAGVEDARSNPCKPVRGDIVQPQDGLAHFFPLEFLTKWAITRGPWCFGCSSGIVATFRWIFVLGSA